MTKDFYESKDQKIFYVFEPTYGKPTGGTVWTAPGATYPFWQRMNIIPDTVDLPVPIRKKEPIYDIGSGKHPTSIITQLYEPTEFTIDMHMQDAAMFAYAIGDAVHDKSGAVEVSTVVCATKDNSVDGSYFFFEGIDDSATGDPPVLHYCWIKTASGTDPSITGATAHECDISGATSADDVGVIIAAVINGLDDFSGGNASGTVTITNISDGAVINTRDSQVTATGYTFTTTTEGYSTLTITESLTRILNSFTLYVQQKNVAGATEDLCKIYFGCVVSSWNMTIDKENHTIRQSVTIKCPYAIDGTLSTEPPPINTAHPFTWNQLQTTENALAVSGTSYLPKATEKITLSIENNVELKFDIGVAYAQYPVAGKREVTLNIIGFVDSDDLYDLYEDTWNNSDGFLESIASQLDSDINIERTVSTDFIRIYIYNWFIDEHDFKVFSISDAIKAVDITLKGGTPDSNRELFSNGSDRPTIVSIDNLRKYHNT